MISPMHSDDNSTDLAMWVVRLSIDDQKERLKAEKEFFIWRQHHVDEAIKIDEMLEFSKQLQTLSKKHVLNANTVQHCFTAHSDAVKQIKKNWGKLAGIGVFAIGSYLTVQMIPYQYYFAEIKTPIGEKKTLRLEDGSFLTLAPDSAVNFTFDQKKRHIELVQGEIMIEVAKDTKRPLIVSSLHADFRAMGTRFIVQQNQQRSRLTLLHSKVLVQTTENPKFKKIISEGQQVDVSLNGITAVKNINPITIENNLNKNQFVAEDIPLSELLEQLEHFHRVYFIYNKKQLADLRVNAVISMQQSPQTILTLITMQYPELRIDQLGSKFILLRLAKNYS